jgi:hypothetical protein
VRELEAFSKEGKDTKRTIAQIMTELSMRVAQTDKTA